MSYSENTSGTRPSPGIEFSLLEDGREIVRLGRWTKIVERGAIIRILYLKDGLAGGDERLHFFAPTLCKTILGERPVKMRTEFPDQLRNILEADGHSPFMRFVSQPQRESDLVGGSEGKARVIVVTIDVVRFDGIASLILG